MPRFSAERLEGMRAKVFGVMERVRQVESGRVHHKALAKLAGVSLGVVNLLQSELNDYIISGHLYYLSHGQRASSDELAEELAKQLMAEDISSDLTAGLCSDTREGVERTISKSIESLWRDPAVRKIRERATDLSADHAVTGMNLDVQVAEVVRIEHRHAMDLEARDKQIRQKDVQIARLEASVERLETIVGRLLPQAAD